MFELELWENDNLLAPGFKIYRRTTLKETDAEKEVPQEDVYGCHFSGHIKDKKHSPASISICNGLVSNKSTSFSYLLVFLAGIRIIENFLTTTLYSKTVF
jgi:hypothetical protein